MLHGGGSQWRYDVDARRSTLLPAGPSAAFDPTGRWLADVSRGVIEVHDIDAGTVVSATFEGEEYHEAVWAPDSSAVVFTAVDEYAECGDDRRSHLLRFDREGSRLSRLTQPAPGSSRVQRWRDDGTLEVVVTGPRVASGSEPSRTERRDALTGAIVAP